LLRAAAARANTSALAAALEVFALEQFQLLHPPLTQSPLAQEAQLNHRQPQAMTVQLLPHSASIPRAAAEVEIFLWQGAMAALAAAAAQIPAEH
jgi:hypothetical protein